MTEDDSIEIVTTEEGETIIFSFDVDIDGDTQKKRISDKKINPT